MFVVDVKPITRHTWKDLKIPIKCKLIVIDNLNPDLCILDKRIMKKGSYKTALSIVNNKTAFNIMRKFEDDNKYEAFWSRISVVQRKNLLVLNAHYPSMRLLNNIAFSVDETRYMESLLLKIEKFYNHENMLNFLTNELSDSNFMVNPLR